MKPPNISPAPLSPFPQSEKRHEEEPVPLVALSESTTVLHAAGEGSAIPLSQLPLPDPTIETVPLEEAYGESPYLKDHGAAVNTEEEP